MKLIALALCLLVLLGLAYIRFAPSDPARWHVDPLVAPDPGPVGVLTKADSGKVFDMPPEALLLAFDEVALAAPRTTVLAGSAAEGHVTYVTRSLLMGFPDYISVKAVPVDGGSRLAVYSRLRFGSSDLGVNRARLEKWAAAIRG